MEISYLASGLLISILVILPDFCVDEYILLGLADLHRTAILVYHLVEVFHQRVFHVVEGLLRLLVLVFLTKIRLSSTLSSLQNIVGCAYEIIIC